MSNTIKVRLTSVGQEQRISDKFSKIEAEFETVGEYPTPIGVEFVNKSIEGIKNAPIGSMGELYFDLRGYRSEKNNKVYTSIRGVSFSIDESYGSPIPKNTKEGQQRQFTETKGAATKEDEYELPF
jgi:hypothetical protein